MSRGRKKGSKIVEGKVIDAINEALPENINIAKVGLGYDIRVDDEVLEGFGSVTEESLSELPSNTESSSSIKWDVPINEPITCFDSNLSYELTKYRPINETQGLDFDPKWFTEVREIKIATGHYTSYKPGTKSHRDFWTEQYRRCIEGYEVNGYRVTGDNYFFLNFYRLMNVTDVKVAGSGRNIGFPNFFSKQYEYFHYIDLCEHLKKDVCALKARGVG